MFACFEQFSKSLILDINNYIRNLNYLIDLNRFVRFLPEGHSLILFSDKHQ